MNCPQCGSADISSSGKCSACGDEVAAPNSTRGSKPAAKDGGNFAGMIKMDYSEGVQDFQPQEEVPQWRKDLSKRLQEIKLKKEAAVASGSKAQTEGKIMQAPKPQTGTDSSEAVWAAKAKLAESKRASKPVPNPPLPTPRQIMLQPLDEEPTAARQDEKANNLRDIRKLIDVTISGQPVSDSYSAYPDEDSAMAPERFEDGDGKLILLSRTLAALIDLICIVICAGVFILAADYFSGFNAPDLISLADFSALLLMTYFVYSIFFLAASNQTIGMMLTDLRVVGIDRRRPPLSRLATRCCFHLVSLLGLGIGLIWGVFNRENLCLHDRLSKTKVVRAY